MIKCIVFDVGGVIWDYSPFQKQLLTQWGLLVNKDYSEIYHHFLNDYKLFQKNKIDYQTWLSRFDASFSTAEAEIILKKLIKSHFEPNLNVKMIKLINDLIKKDLAVGCLSNTEYYMKTFYRELFQVVNFDFQILSYQVGFSKPEPEIYEEIFRYGAWRSGEILFIDDTSRNIKGAQKIGLKTAHYHDFNQLFSSLDDFGIKV